MLIVRQESYVYLSQYTVRLRTKFTRKCKVFHMFCHCDDGEIIGAQSLTNNCCFVRFLQPVYPSTSVVNSASTKYKDKFEIDLHVICPAKCHSQHVRVGRQIKTLPKCTNAGSAWSKQLYCGAALRKSRTAVTIFANVNPFTAHVVSMDSRNNL